MAKTFLQRNVSYYDRLIKEAENSPYAKNYQKVCNALKSLVEITNKLRDKVNAFTGDNSFYDKLSARLNYIYSLTKEKIAKP